MQLDLRGRLDRVAARIPPLRVALAVQDRYSALRGNQLAAAITLTAFLALFALVLIAVAVVGFVSAGSADVPSRVHPRAPLAKNDRARQDDLSIGALDAEALRVAVAAVT